MCVISLREGRHQNTGDNLATCRVGGGTVHVGLPCTIVAADDPFSLKEPPSLDEPIFRQVAKGRNFRHNAVVPTDEDEYAVGIGFAEAGKVLVEHWQSSGPNDLLFIPIMYVYRHALELLLKAAIRETAARRRTDGHTDPQLAADELDKWLASLKGGGHSLQALGTRLEGYLAALGLENLPTETTEALRALHELDPTGDAFRYATVRDRETKRFVSAPRPKATLVNVVAMGQRFDWIVMLLGGLMSLLDNYREYQEAMRSEGPSSQ